MVARSVLRAAEHGIFHFEEIHFFVPVDSADGVTFVVSWADSATGEAVMCGSVEIDKKILGGLVNRSAVFMRRFPVQMVSSWKFEPLVLKLRISQQSVSHGVSSSDQQGVVDRYTTLLLRVGSVLSGEVAATSGAEVTHAGGAVSSGSLAFSLGQGSPLLRRSVEGSDKGSNRAKAHHSGAPRKSLPQLPGEKPSSLRPFLYAGRPSRVVSLLVEVGSHVLFGSSILECIVHDDGAEQDSSSSSTIVWPCQKRGKRIWLFATSCIWKV